MAASVLSRIDQNGHIEVLDGGPTPAVTVDTDGRLHTGSGVIPHAGENLERELRRWLS